MSDSAEGILLTEKLRLQAKKILEDRIEKDLMSYFKYKILPSIKKEMAGKIVASTYEDDKVFQINITIGGEE